MTRRAERDGILSGLRTAATSSAAGYVVVFCAMTVFTVSCFRVGLERYRIFRAGVDDGIFMQVLTSALDGFHARAEGDFNHLSVHFSPILFLIAPIATVTHSAVALIAIQSFAGSLVALPLFLIARKRMPVYLAAAAASITLLYPPLVGVMTGDFHEHAFTPAAVAWTLWAVDAGRFWPALLCGMTALCVKEDVPVIFLIDGLLAGSWFYYRGDFARSKLCFILAFGGAMTLVAYFTLLIPLLHVPFAYQSFHFYNGSAATSPAGFAGPGDPIRWRYVLLVLAQLCFLPLLSIGVVLCLPGIVEVLASRESITMELSSHYAAVWIPFMLLAFVLAIGRIAKWSRVLALGLTLVAGLNAALIIQFADPTARWYYNYRRVNEEDRTLDRFLASLPPNVDISVLYDVYAHLGDDPNATIYPALAEYVLLDTLHETEDRSRQAQLVASLLAGGKYYRIPAPSGIVLIKRR